MKTYIVFSNIKSLASFKGRMYAIARDLLLAFRQLRQAPAFILVKEGAAGIGSAEFLWRNLLTGIAREIVITTP